ncbi:glycosyltransferase family 2 protein [Sporosarcina koreensis]|uniref:glycosyltransferase family 2 protein n=1 Tax=Sporosarcina koreensis TaxID=334735 RepID=UPI00075611CD|nr:glycosyltransferase family 2 protein [Sporosarcina koreensis]
MIIKVSIIIPVYNVENYLEDTIESVLKQSYKNIEIILINDGSTDNSKKVCERYAAQYDFIYLIDQENGGLSKARNIGVKEAKGEYIIFLDSDDFWEDNLLDILRKYLHENTDVDYLFFRHFEYFETTKRKKERSLNIDPEIINQLRGLDTLSYILDREKYFPWYACLSIIRSEFIRENNLLFQVGRNYEDVLWTPEVFMNAYKVGFVNKALHVYRRDREGQITSQISYQNLRDSIFIADYWMKKTSQLNREDLKVKIMNNIIPRYFYALWFSGFLNKRNRKMILRELQDHCYLLDYRDTPIQKLTYMLISCFGFALTSKIFKSAINVKRLLMK